MGYRKIGDLIQLVDVRNKDLSITHLVGLTINKKFIPSVANIIGTDMSNYKIIHKNQFACSTMQVRRDKKMPVALLKEFDVAIISQAYPVFEVIDENEILPEYLMLWFTRSEFDREACFHAVGGVRGSLEWEDFCNMELPVPSIEKQRKIVAQYQAVENKIKVNEQICEKLEATAQALYKQWFVNVEDSDSVFLSEYIDTNPSLTLKKGQIANYTEMSDLSENQLSIKAPILREYNGGSRFQNNDTLLARITPCLENGKTGFVNYLKTDEIGYGSTEFIVIRPKSFVSPYWIYCLCKDEDFRSFAISSMVGSSGRQRVHESYLMEYKYPKINADKMKEFDNVAFYLFEEVKTLNSQNQKLSQLQSLLLSRLARLEEN